MTQDEFIAQREQDWRALDDLLTRGSPLDRLAPGDIARAAALYRAICADLMRARARGYGPDVLAVLDGLAARGHNALYSAPPYRFAAVWDLIARDFPRTLRRHVRFFVAALALFVLPGLVGFVGALRSRAFALQLLPQATVEQMEKSYAEGFNRGRDEGKDVMMAGFYVHNNVGIAFRCFALGILFGLGSVFFLVYNGLVIGAVAGLVTAAGHGMNLLTFTSGHGSFELTAIVIAGAAGMLMGFSLVDTGGLTRFASLRRRARDLAHLIIGAGLMLVVAAGIEGFWSPSGVPMGIKLGVAAALYLLVACYLALAGRTGAPTVAGGVRVEARR